MDDISDRDASGQPQAPSLVLCVRRRIAIWRHRARGRKELAELMMDARMLRDIGMSRAQAQHEIKKPFWRP